MKREYDFRNAKRGAVVSVPKGKTRITIRLDDEILAWFRDWVELAGCSNYQTVINEVLRQHIPARQRTIGKNAPPRYPGRDPPGVLACTIGHQLASTATLRWLPRDNSSPNSGPSGSLLLTRRALSSPPSDRFIPALC